MKIDWASEFRKIRPERLGIVVGVLAFFVGLILGTRNQGIGWGVAWGFASVLSVFVLIFACAGLVGLLGGLLVTAYEFVKTLGELIESSPQLRKRVMSFLRWLQSYY